MVATAVGRAGTAMLLIRSPVGPSQSHFQSLGPETAFVPTVQRRASPKEKSACAQQGVAGRGHTRPEASPAPLPPHRLELGVCPRGVCARNRATGLGRNKATSPEETETRFKNAEQLLPGSTCPDQNTGSEPESAWGCADTSPATRRFCRIHWSPSQGGDEHRGRLFPVVCGSGLLTSLPCLGPHVSDARQVPGATY